MKNTESDFESDPVKAAKNEKKHKKKNGAGLTFEEAQEVFDDEYALEEFDAENSTLEEARYRVIGRIKNHIVVLVVYTPRNEKRRIISARLAVSRERKRYYEQVRRYYSGM